MAYGWHVKGSMPAWMLEGPGAVEEGENTQGALLNGYQDSTAPWQHASCRQLTHGLLEKYSTGYMSMTAGKHARILCMEKHWSSQSLHRCKDSGHDDAKLRQDPSPSIAGCHACYACSLTPPLTTSSSTVVWQMITTQAVPSASFCLQAHLIEVATLRMAVPGPERCIGCSHKVPIPAKVCPALPAEHLHSCCWPPHQHSGA